MVRIVLKSIDHIGQEFFRFELATAVAGSVLGINPFDQPDVESAKIKTRELTAAFEKTGALPEEEAVLSSDSLELYTDENNENDLSEMAAEQTVASWLKAHFARAASGDYLALLAYIAHDENNIDALQGIRLALRDKFHLATCAQFGPRFLHSTGQAYKGGPDWACFCRSPRMTPRISRYPDRRRASASSRRHRRAATSMFSPSAAAVPCAYT